MPFKINDAIPISYFNINVKMTSQNDVTYFLIKLGGLNWCFYQSTNSGISMLTFGSEWLNILMARLKCNFDSMSAQLLRESDIVLTSLC